MARSGRGAQDGPDLFAEDTAAEEPRERRTFAESHHTHDEPIRSDRHALIVEADGGSRGNPGQAAYGVVVRDGVTHEVLDREGLPLGIVSNNVAEYSGLIAGLEIARTIAPAASVEVRMDSRLVIEQMAGTWKIKHPDMKALALRAQGLRPRHVTWTWIPRAQNKAADALVNQALDGRPRPRQHPMPAA